MARDASLIVGPVSADGIGLADFNGPLRARRRVRGTAGSVVLFAASVGLVSAASSMALKALSGLFGGLGLLSWQADLLSGMAGFGVAVSMSAHGARQSRAGGLSPAQAMAQLRTDIDLAAMAFADRRSSRSDIAGEAEGPP